MENIKEEDNTFLGLPLDGKAAVNFANYMMSQERFEIMSDRAKNNPELYFIVYDADCKNWADAYIKNNYEPVQYSPKQEKCILTDGFEVECSSSNIEKVDSEIKYDKDSDTLTITNPNSIKESLGVIGNMLQALTA